MVDYAASKHAALAFHEGLAAELATRYRARKVRTVVVNQGYTRTALFEGYRNDVPFLMPNLEPETVAEAIVRQVLSGKSGQIIRPAFANSLTVLASMPHWYQYGLRADGHKISKQLLDTILTPSRRNLFKKKPLPSVPCASKNLPRCWV